MTILKNTFTKNELEQFKNECSHENYKTIKERIIANPKMQSIIKNKVGNGYIFQDYIFIIKKSAIHTCHRDGNGDFFNEKQKYPSLVAYFSFSTWMSWVRDVIKAYADYIAIPITYRRRLSHRSIF